MDQLLEAFHNLANGDRLITETNMRQAHLSPEVMNFLKQTMQATEQDDQGQPGYDCESTPLDFFLGHLTDRGCVQTNDSCTIPL